MAITVRSVTKDEREVWEALVQAYAEFYKTSMDSGSFDRVWDWIFDENEKFWCDFVEDDQGKVIGFTQYQLMHRSLSGEMVCYLSDLFVKPGVRGGGYGRAMIDHVIEFAKANKIPNVRWLTQEYNYTARKLYDRYTPKSDFILYAVPIE